MTNPLMHFAELLVVALFTVGPLIALMLLLNARDRREAALLETMWYLAPRDLRPLIAILAHCDLLSRMSVVEVDMWGCARDEIWDAIARWRAGLPPGVRLLVNGSMDRRLATSFTIETTYRPELSRPQHASS